VFSFMALMLSPDKLISLPLPEVPKLSTRYDNTEKNILQLIIKHCTTVLNVRYSLICCAELFQSK
jgi:hypothetical protein